MFFLFLERKKKVEDGVWEAESPRCRWEPSSHGTCLVRIKQVSCMMFDNVLSYCLPELLLLENSECTIAASQP
jgi:hypothetical protein